MPTAHQLLTACVVASVVAVVVVLVLQFVGLGEHAVIAAGVSAGVAASTVTVQLRSTAKKEDSPA